MRQTPITLQDLRRKIYTKAKTETSDEKPEKELAGKDGVRNGAKSPY